MMQSQLVSRDPALAALMGAISMQSSNREADFGDDYDFGTDYEFGDDDMFGDSYAFAADAPAAAAPMQVSKAEVVKAFKRQQAVQAKTNQRLNVLMPNRGSEVDVERYSFTLSQSITIGTAADLILSGSPDTKIRPQRVTMNAPSPFFAFIRDIKVANVSIIVGGGVEDAFNYNAQGVGQSLDMPLLLPSNRASVSGDYSGFTPPGIVPGMAAHFTVSFKGPSSLTA
jgi:hypothetical protein